VKGREKLGYFAHNDAQGCGFAQFQSDLPWRRPREQRPLPNLAFGNNRNRRVVAAAIRYSERVLQPLPGRSHRWLALRKRGAAPAVPV